MPVIAMRILVVGTRAPGTTPMLERMAARGFGARDVPTAKEARQMLATFRFDAVLAAESLPDGSGYDLADMVAEREATLAVGVALSESCLWLPVIERGAKVLGKRALSPRMLELELDLMLLGLRDVAGKQEDAAPLPAIERAQVDSHRTKVPRRGKRGAAA